MPKERDRGTFDPALLASLGKTAHLYLAAPDRLAPTGDCAHLIRLLSDEERRRYEGFGHPAPRRLFLSGRGLIRSVLSRYCETAPDSWILRTGVHGRPEIEGPAGTPPLRFNLAHTDQLLACIVALDRDCGIDVEDLERRLDTLRIAEHSFAATEIEDLRSLEKDALRERFFSYWTLKEAYLKARGDGISLRLDAAVFSIAQDGRLAVRFAERAIDSGDNWQFDLFAAGSRHLLATAIEHRGGAPLEIVTRQGESWSTSLALTTRSVALPRLAASHPANPG